MVPAADPPSDPATRSDFSLLSVLEMLPQAAALIDSFSPALTWRNPPQRAAADRHKASLIGRRLRQDQRIGFLLSPKGVFKLENCNKHHVSKHLSEDIFHESL